VTQIRRRRDKTGFAASDIECLLVVADQPGEIGKQQVRGVGIRGAGAWYVSGNSSSTLVDFAGQSVGDRLLYGG